MLTLFNLTTTISVQISDFTSSETGNHGHNYRHSCLHAIQYPTLCTILNLLSVSVFLQCSLVHITDREIGNGIEIGMSRDWHIQKYNTCGVCSEQCCWTVLNWQPRLINARGERKLAHVVRYNRQATVAQIAEEMNLSSDTKCQTQCITFCRI